MQQGAVTYDEIRTWARWLEFFTARDMADALGVSLEVGERAVKALLWHGICVDTGVRVNGPAGEEPLIRRLPLPKGPTVHPTQAPPEVVVRMEMGGDPLRVPRGLPVGMRNGGRQSGVGRWRPGRTQRPSKTKVEREAEARARNKGLSD